MVRRVPAVVVLLLLAAAAASAQTKVNGDARAWEEVQAAFDRLGKLRSYRARITAPGVTTVVVNEVVPPDRLRVVQQMGNVTFEFITVGSETRLRILSPGIPATWQCVPPTQAASLRPQQPATPDEVTITRLGESSIEGTRTQGYQYTQVVQGRPVTQRLHMLVETGLPRRLEVMDSSGNITAVVDYYDFNAPITIELPRCG